MPALGVNLWAYCALAVMLVAAAVADVRTGKVPNAVTYPGALLGLVGHTTVWLLTDAPEALGPLGSLAGLAAGFLPLLLAWKAGGMGGGDAKLMGAVGALTGWWFVLATMFYGLIIAAVMALGMLIRRRALKATTARMWRFLVLSFTPGKPADPTTSESMRIPLGLAFCIGAAAAVAEVLIRGGQPTLFMGS